jgi:hypothetical protein
MSAVPTYAGIGATAALICALLARWWGIDRTGAARA